MHDDEAYFLRLVDELRSRGSSTDRYELIRASGPLRLLLLDGLLDKVNRSHRLKFSFEVMGSGQPLPLPSRARVHVHWQDIDPTRALPAAQRRRLGRDELLGTEILTYEGESITVRDLISTAANAMGGVHKGDPKDGPQRRVFDLDEALRAGPLPSQITGALASLGISVQVPDGVAALRGLIAVVLRGIQPLVEAIRAVPGNS